MGGAGAPGRRDVVVRWCRDVRSRERSHSSAARPVYEREQPYSRAVAGPERVRSPDQSLSRRVSCSALVWA